MCEQNNQLEIEEWDEVMLKQAYILLKILIIKRVILCKNEFGKYLYKFIGYRFQECRFNKKLLYNFLKGFCLLLGFNIFLVSRKGESTDLQKAI